MGRIKREQEPFWLSGGEPCFADSTVPMRLFIAHLKQGNSIDSFLQHYTAVDRGQVLEQLDMLQSFLVLR